MKHLYPILSLLLLTTVSACSHIPGFGSGPKQDRVVGHWQVMTTAKGKPDALCYAQTVPIKSQSAVKDRETPYLMATRRISGKIEISVSAGYAFKKNRKVTLTVDKTPYRLFFHDNVAWAKSDDDDKDIITALKKAHKVEVRATAKSGGTSVDTYSADGFAPALARVKQLCP